MEHCGEFSTTQQKIHLQPYCLNKHVVQDARPASFWCDPRSKMAVRDIGVLIGKKYYLEVKRSSCIINDSHVDVIN